MNDNEDYEPEEIYAPLLTSVYIRPHEDPISKAIADQNKDEASMRTMRRNAMDDWARAQKTADEARKREFLDKRRMIMITGRRLEGITPENFNCTREEVKEMSGEDAANLFIAHKRAYNRDIRVFEERWDLDQNQKSYVNMRQELTSFSFRRLDRYMLDLDRTWSTRQDLLRQVNEKTLMIADLNDRLAKKRQKIRDLKRNNEELHKTIADILKSDCEKVVDEAIKEAEEEAAHSAGAAIVVNENDSILDVENEDAPAPAENGKSDGNADDAGDEPTV